MITNKDFTDLHIHSFYSLLDGTAAPEAILKATKELGRDTMALTDHGSIDGLIRFQKAAKKQDIKPIFGIELYLMEDWEHRKGCDCKWGTHKNLHLTALAKTEAGLGKIIKACGYANTEGWGKAGRSGRPFLPIDYPLTHNWGGDVVVLTGCASSPFWNARNGIELLSKYKEEFGADLYAETMPIHDWPEQYLINELATTQAKELDLKTVITTDVHYITKEDSKFHEVVLGLSQPEMTWNNPKRWKFSTHSSHIHTVEQIVEAFGKMGWRTEDTEQAIKNTREISEKCFHKLEQKPIWLPKVVDVPDDQEEDFFIQLVFDGLKRRGVDSENYLERAGQEIDLFVKKGFVRYMLMVWDVVKWAKENGVMIGPSRGSVGGSLVAYALRITDIDPIYHRLSFERFISPDRIDMPDIDIDVEDRNRHLVEEYLKEKYGRFNVAHVSTFSTMLGRTAIKDVARLFEVPLQETVEVCHTIIKRHESDDRVHETINDTIKEGGVILEYQKKYPEIIEYAARLEGAVRGGGIHAAGFVVSPKDLREYDWAHYVSRKDNVCINWDKDDLEHMGLVKLDLLGLSTMSAISECLRLVKNTTGNDIDPTTIPLDDKPTYEMLSKGDTATVFQLGTPGTTKFCRTLKPENFEHVAAIPALWKPGPIQAGMTDRYMKVRHGQAQPNFLNEAHKKITEITNGELIYQEQIVSLLTDIAGFTYRDADKVRKIISKQQGQSAWTEWEEKFVQGCLKMKTLTEQQAHELWQALALFAIYCLNRAHSVGYGMIAYWCAYLKCHYPAEWLCAYLNYGNADREDAKTGEINRDVALREALRLGLEILVPDINHSNILWAVEKNSKGKSCLRVGLQDIKFFGDKAKEVIQKDKALGDYQNINDFLTRVDGKSVNKKVFWALLACGAFNSIEDENNLKKWIVGFDDLWEQYGKKKFQKIWEVIDVGLYDQEKMNQERKLYLKFDPVTLEGASTLRKIAEIVGGEVKETEEDFVVERDGHIWTFDDVSSGLMPGANGIIKVVDVSLKDIQRDSLKCTKCDLRKSCKKPVPILDGAVNIMVVAEAPGRDEDQHGKPLIGDAGSILWAEMAAHGISKNDVFVTNVVKCKPLNKQKPTPENITACSWLTEEIKRIKPLIILALGNSSLYYFTGKEKGIMEMNGKTEWNHKANAWVVYGINPSSCLYSDHGDRRPMLRQAISEFSRLIGQFG